MLRKIKEYICSNPGIIVFLIIYLLLIIFLSPFHEFPLNDSWAYAKSVKHFLDTGGIRLSDWGAASLIFQILWGSLFSMFGFSFGALRLSTLILSLLGVIGFYFLLKEFRFQEKTCILGSMLLLFNPLYFNLSYTFMTDVPMVSLSLLSVLFYIKGIKKENHAWLLTGSIMMALAVLVRQNAILILMAVFFYCILTREKNNLTWRQALIILIIPILALASFQFWYKFIHKAGIKYVIATQAFSNTSPMRIAEFLFIIMICLGFYFFPLLFTYLVNINKGIRGCKWLILWIILSILFLAGLIIYSILIKNLPFFGYMGFIVNEYGIGPKMLAGSAKEIFPSYIWLIIGCLSAICAAVISVIMLRSMASNFKGKLKNLIMLKLEKSSLYILIYIIMILQLVFIVSKASIFDRYLLVIIPFIILILLHFSRNLKCKSTWLIITIIIFGIFSITGTHDYISWNKARWGGYDYLTNVNVSVMNIDGGFELNGWFLYEYALEKFGNESIETADKASNETRPWWFGIREYKTAKAHPCNKNAISWWFVVDDKYVVSFSPLPQYNYQVIKQIEYKSYLSFGRKYIYILKRS